MQADHDTGGHGGGTAAVVSNYQPLWLKWTCVLAIEPGGMFLARCPELGLAFRSQSYAIVCMDLMNELAYRAAALLSALGAADTPATGA